MSWKSRFVRSSRNDITFNINVIIAFPNKLFTLWIYNLEKFLVWLFERRTFTRLIFVYFSLSHILHYTHFICIYLLLTGYRISIGGDFYTRLFTDELKLFVFFSSFLFIFSPKHSLLSIFPRDRPLDPGNSLLVTALDNEPYLKAKGISIRKKIVLLFACTRSSHVFAFVVS